MSVLSSTLVAALALAAQPAPTKAPTTTTATTPATTTPATTTPKSGDRTGDGIDDENWLPRKDTKAYQRFQEAVEVARRDPAGAVARFVDAASATNGFYAAWFNAGAAAEAAGDVGSAERHYRQALATRPDYGLALLNLSALLTRMSRDSEAQRLIDDAARRFPEKAGPHLAAATRALQLRDLTKAEEEARASMRFDERNVPAMWVMARVFRAQGRLDTARFAIDNALALEPGNALLHLERGHVLLAQTEKKDALVAFERAARLRPALAEAQEAYGLLALELGYSAEALRALDALVRLEPKGARAQLHHGNALRASKQYPQAEAAYRKALELDPALDEARFNLGVLYLDNPVAAGDELGRWKTGLQSLQDYKKSGRADAATSKRLDEYIEATEKRIAKEQKRREREEKRKADDAKKPPAPAPAPAAATPAAAAPPAAPAPKPAADPKNPAPVGGSDDK